MWVWVNSGSWWWRGRPGMLQFMGLQRVGHDWATELKWAVLACSCSFWFVAKSYALSEKLSAIIKKIFWSIFPIQYSISFTVHQSESATHVNISPYPHSFVFPFHLDHHKMMAQGTQTLFFFLSLILYFQLHVQPSLLSSTGPWSYVHFLFSLFSRLVNIQTSWSFCHLQYIVKPCGFLIIYFLVLPIGLDF